MSSLMYKPTIEGTPPASSPNQPGRRVVSPAFAPQFRRSLMQHPLLAGAVTVVVTVLLLAYAMRMHPVYSAESLVYIEPLNTKVLSDASGATFDSTRYESLIQQEMQTAQRLDIMQSALGTLPPSTWAEFGPNITIAAQNLQNQLKVVRVTMSYQVSISLKGSDPVKTTAIVNAVTTAFLQAGRKDQLSDADQRSQLLAEERQRIEQELAQARSEQTQLSAQLGIANPTGEGSNPFDTQLDNLRSQLTTARTNHEMAAAQLAALSGTGANHASGLTAAANDAIASDAGLSSMRATINQRRATLSSQMADLMPANPVYKQDQDELADLDKTLETMTQQMRDKAARGLQDKLRSELDRTGDVAGRLNSEVARQTANATGAAPKLQRASDLSAEVLRLQTRYAAVDNALHSLQLETTGPGMVHLALAASVPTGPEPNRKRLVELAALPLGFLCGLTAAVFARKRDQHIYTSGDVDDIMGFAPIAVLPAQDEVSDAVLQEYYLRLAAGVEGAYRSGGARTFMLTAVSASTEIASLVQELDHKLSQLGLGVIIVDASQMLVSDEDQTTERSPTGFDRRFEGLAPSILERMKGDHDLVLLEAPALLYSAQAEYVARCADVTVLVAESGVTTRQEMFRSGALLQRLNVNGVGAVLTALSLRHADEGFRKTVGELDRRTPSARAIRREQSPITPIAAVPESATFVPQEAVTPAFVEPATIHDIEEEPVRETESATEPVEPIRTSDRILSVVPPIVAVASEPQDAPEPPPLVTTEEPRQPVAPIFAPKFETPAVEAATMNKSWLQRLFNRDTEAAYSILPDSAEDVHSSYDEPEPARGLGLVPPVAMRHDALDLPVREPESITEAQPVIAPLPPPVAVVVAMPAPKPYVPPAVPVEVPAEPAPVAVATPAAPVRPLSFAELTQLREPQVALTDAEPVYAAVPEPEPEPRPKIAEVALTTVPEQAVTTPVAESTEAAPAPEAVLTPEPVAAAAEPVSIQPEVVTELRPDPAPALALVPDPSPTANVPETESVIEEWVPAPLNRWDPIPPLRADEPWRSRQFQAAPAKQQEPVWAQEDPMHIPPTDRWGAPEATYPPEVASETPDIVLTRRWGLLSRFQQGESFAPDNRDDHREEAPPAYRTGDRRG